MSVSESAGNLKEQGMQSGSEMQRLGGMEAHPQGERSLEAFLTNWLTTRSATGTLQTSDRRVLEHQIPLPIRLTLDQLLNLADETELRALTLEWMTRSFQVGDQSPRKEQTLLQITAQLRRMAAQLRTEDWREPA
jgi:hypothetical protein